VLRPRRSKLAVHVQLNRHRNGLCHSTGLDAAPARRGSPLSTDHEEQRQPPARSSGGKPGSWASSPAVRSSMLGNKSRDTHRSWPSARHCIASGCASACTRGPSQHCPVARTLCSAGPGSPCSSMAASGTVAPKHYRVPATNPEYWLGKIATNQRRTARRTGSSERAVGERSVSGSTNPCRRPSRASRPPKRRAATLAHEGASGESKCDGLGESARTVFRTCSPASGCPPPASLRTQNG
jgi:hypothetical protein